MKIVVTTPTGNVGSRVTRVLLQAGVRPTLLLRDPTKLDAQTRELGDVVQGDQFDPEGVLRVTWPVDAAMPWVDPRDVGDVAAARLLATGWSGRQVQAVHGPEDLSYAQVAAIVSRATGRPLRAEQIPDDQMREALRAAGLGDAQVEGIVGMSTGLREDFAPEDPRTALTTTPTTLASWAHQQLA